jgi:hypothetical protein
MTGPRLHMMAGRDVAVEELEGQLANVLSHGSAGCWKSHSFWQPVDRAIRIAIALFPDGRTMGKRKRQNVRLT